MVLIIGVVPMTAAGAPLVWMMYRYRRGGRRRDAIFSLAKFLKGLGWRPFLASPTSSARTTQTRHTDCCASSRAQQHLHGNIKNQLSHAAR